MQICASPWTAQFRATGCMKENFQDGSLQSRRAVIVLLTSQQLSNKTILLLMAVDHLGFMQLPALIGKVLAVMPIPKY